MRPIRLALALLGALALSGCAAALPWISVIAAGITLLGNTENASPLNTPAWFRCSPRGRIQITVLLSLMETVLFRFRSK